jgi:tripartite-type tricarboxylate transporter receptor subunit TctC
MKKNILTLTLMAIFSLLLVLIFVDTPKAADNFPFKGGDTIVLTVPFAPGGGFDFYARILAPQLEAELEKVGDVNIKVIVKNVPGAGGRLAHEQVYKAKPDARTLSLLIGHEFSMPYYEVIYGAKMKSENFTYLAQISRFFAAIVARKDLQVNTFKELLERSVEKPILMGTSGRGGDPHVAPLLTSSILEEEGLQWKIDFVHYEGTAPARASLSRKETEAMMTAAGTLLPVEAMGDGKLLLIFSEERDPRMEHVPTIVEQKIPRAKDIINSTSGAWLLIGPPEIPKAKTEVLRKTAFSAITSEAFQQKAAKAKRTVSYLSGDECREIAVSKVETIQQREKMIKEAMGIE